MNTMQSILFREWVTKVLENRKPWRPTSVRESLIAGRLADEVNFDRLTIMEAKVKFITKFGKK